MLPRLKRPRWELSAFYVNQLHLQFGVEGGGVIAEGTALSTGRFLYVPLSGLHHANGIPLGTHSIFVIDPGCEFTISVLEEHRWCSIYIPSDVSNDGVIEGEPDDTAPKGARVVELGTHEIGALRRLLLRLRYADEDWPNGANADAARSLRAELDAVCRRISISTADEAPGAATGRPLLVRSELARIVRDRIECGGDEGVTIEELAVATDVSQRTLRSLFLEYFGVPPRRYLLIRRLNQVRSVLRTSEPDETTVTSVAAQFGFWHLGRFAGTYSELFGETPSATLHQARRRQPAQCI